MPPNSRGQILRHFRIRTRIRAQPCAHTRPASSTAIPDLPKIPTRLTKAPPSRRVKPNDLSSSSSASSTSSPPPSPPTPPPKHDPNAPYVPFRAPPGAPSIGVRLVRAFGPKFRPLVQFILYTIPWIPPFYLALMHIPVNVIPTRGQSMTPSLNGDHVADEPNTDDWVLVDVRNSVKVTLQRGMVVVYRSPHNPERWGVKRVIALEGDRITPKPGFPGGDGPLIVPWGHVWVEGDAEDRDKSLDSNWFGPISRNLIVGRAAWVVWPWKHFAELEWEGAKLPDRLEADAVRLESPDDEAVANVFRNGYAQGILARLRDPTTGAAARNYRAQPKVLAALLKTCREEADKHDPETEALAFALYREVKLVLDNKGKLPVEVPPADLPLGAGVEQPDDTGAESAARAQNRVDILKSEKAVEVPERTPPTIIQKLNHVLSTPDAQDTPRPVVS